MANKVKEGGLGLPFGGKILTGNLTTFDDGTAQWTYKDDTALFGDQSTFTSSKKPDGTWTWSPTTDKSIPNLSGRVGLTEKQITEGLYKTPEVQTALNGQRVNLLGGIQSAKKIDPTLPQTGGVQTSTTTPQDQTSAASTEGETEATAAGVGQGLTNLTNTQIAGSKKTRLVTQYPRDSLLKYPIDMDTKQDCIKFTMLEYRPRKLSPKLLGEGKALEDRPEATTELKTRGSTVVLPIQPSISDTNTVKWGEDTMNSFQAIAAATALGTIKDGVVGATESISGIAKLFATTSGSLSNAAAAYFAGEAAQVKGLVPRVLGGIINPNIELLFEGPQLRTFQFNFTLSAREENESKNIRNIIRFFKQGMSVKRAETDLFLKAPHTFEIKYIYGLTQKDHPWINKIKECALTGCTVNYTPAGSYATFIDGAMTSYEIGLQFSELEAIYDDDYKLLDENTNDPNNIVIGY
jgi:hypothetical protein